MGVAVGILVGAEVDVDVVETVGAFEGLMEG